MTSRPYSMREDRQAEAGLSQMRRPAARARVADVLLGQSGVEQRSGDVMLLGGRLAGTEVALVVEIYAVGDGVEAAAGCGIPPSR